MGEFNLSTDLRRQGLWAESEFAAWLDRSGRPYILVEQSRGSMPAHLRGAFKRPDFFVGYPTIGLVGCEIKAKSLFNGAFIMDEMEIVNLDRFARAFNIHIWLYFFPPEEPEICFIAQNSDLLALERRRVRKRICVSAAPEAMTCARFLETPFETALFAAAH